MVSGLKLSKENIQNIISTYRRTDSIYQAAKKNNTTYKTALKYINIYINNNKPVEARSLLPQLKDRSAQANKDINNNNIYNINNNISDNNMDSAISTNKINISKLDNYYISSINSILKKFISRYKKEYRDISIDKLYLHFGTLFDKMMAIQDKDKLSPDSQVVINFYGNEDKVRDMINKIRNSKRRYMDSTPTPPS